MLWSFEQPSQKFLKFAAQFLSSHKSDTNNNPAFKSCLLRVPGSYNSKYMGENRETSEVKIIQSWDRFRPKINPLLYQFYIFLADKRLKELNSIGKNQTKSNYTFRGNTIHWIEKLLHTPTDDYRKSVVSLILGPYLINIKKLSYDDALNIINTWLSKCSKLRQLDCSCKYMLRYALKNAEKNGYRPLKLDTLKLRNKALHHLLID